MDYKENYLKEKIGRLKAEAELVVIRHGKLLEEYEKTKLALDTYIIEKKQEEAKKEEEKSTGKKRTYKRRKKDEQF